MWSPPGPVGECVIIAGPFHIAAGVDEFIVAPLHGGNDVPSDEDVPIERNVWAAIWAATPVLGEDLRDYLGSIQQEVLSRVTDRYWAAQSEPPAAMPPARGNPFAWLRRRKRQAYRAEVRARWGKLYQRVLARCEELSTDVSWAHFGWVVDRAAMTAFSFGTGYRSPAAAPPPVHEISGVDSVVIGAVGSVTYKPMDIAQMSFYAPRGQFFTKALERVEQNEEPVRRIRRRLGSIA
jgi:hypothetical protein